jgi:hypothetical protein
MAGGIQNVGSISSVGQFRVRLERLIDPLQKGHALVG